MRTELMTIRKPTRIEQQQQPEADVVNVMNHESSGEQLNKFWLIMSQILNVGGGENYEMYNRN